MAVKIRLARRGRKKLALYDIVVADERSPRDGRLIEKLGNYNPNTNPSTTSLKQDKTVQWLLNGAQPTNTVRNILSAQGVLLRKHLQVGVHKGAITQEEADKRWDAWQQEKLNKLGKKAAPVNITKTAPKKAEPTKPKTAAPATDTATQEATAQAPETITQELQPTPASTDQGETENKAS